MMDATLKITPLSLETKPDGSQSALLEWSSTGADSLVLKTTVNGVAASTPLASLSGSMTLTSPAVGTYLYELQASANPIVRSATLTVTAPMPPMPLDPARQAEYDALMALVPRGDATCVAIRDGLASDPNTWSGCVPGDGDCKVLVPAGRTVTWDQGSCIWLRVDGTVNITGSLTVDTIVCDMGSTLMASPGAYVTFSDSGPIDTTKDPLMLGRGLIAHGTVNIRGTPQAPDLNRARAWKPGDVVTLARSITFESQATDPTRRGHVMFMHSNQVYCEGVLFRRIGRTDKSKLVTDPVVGKPATLANPRGRYACHVHRAGGKKGETPAIIRGCAVVDAIGWGIVNHSSHVVVCDCEAYNVFGASYVGEAGNEMGSFIGNVSIYSPGIGSASGPADNRGNRDFGFQGHGIWIQGGGTVEVSGNISTGAGQSDIFHMGLECLPYPIANLDDPSIWPKPADVTMPSQDVPLRVYRNECYSPGGLVIWAIHNGHFHATDSRVEDNLLRKACCTLGYSGYVHFLRNRHIGDVNKPLPKSAIGNTGASISGMTYEHLTVEGWQVGLYNPCTEDQPDAVASRIIGGHYNNICSIYINNTQQGWKRTLLIDGTQTYGTLSATALTGNRWPYWWAGTAQPQWDIYLGLNFYSWNIASLEGWPYTSPMSETQWRMLFASPNLVDGFGDVIKLGGDYVSFAEFGPTYNLGILKNLPADLRLKPDGTPRTTADLAADRGLFMGARTLPADARQVSRVRGWLHATPATFR